MKVEKTLTSRLGALSEAESLPLAEDAEQQIISYVLQKPEERGPEVRTKITAAAFLLPVHRLLWDLICELLDGGKEISFAPMCAVLRDRSQLEKVGAAFLSELFHSVQFWNTQRVDFSLDIIREKWLLRCLVDESVTTIEAALQHQVETGSSTVQALIGDAEQRIFSVVVASQSGQDDPKRRPAESGVVGEQFVVNFENTLNHLGKIPGILTGIADLDRTFNGLAAQNDGDMWSIVAQPGMGKSALAASLIWEMSAIQKVPGMAFPLEMGRDQYANRMIPGRAGVNTQCTRNGMISKQDKAEIPGSVVEFSHMPVIWDNSSSIEIADLRAKVQVAIRKHGIRYIIIDHFGQLRPSSKAGKADERLGEIEIMNVLHDMRRSLGILVIVLFQMNKEGTSKSSSLLYSNSDVKGAADKVELPTHITFLRRPCMTRPWARMQDQWEQWQGLTKQFRENQPTRWYDPNADRWVNGDIEVAHRDYLEHATLQVSKNRNGGTPEQLCVRFIPELQIFMGRTADVYSNNPANRQVTLSGF